MYRDICGMPYSDNACASMPCAPGGTYNVGMHAGDRGDCRSFPWCPDEGRRVKLLRETSKIYMIYYHRFKLC